MGASKPTSSGSTSTSTSTSTQAFAHLSPRVRHISQNTIRKKWKPLPQSSQEKVRAILLSLKTKRAATGRVPAIGRKARPSAAGPRSKAKTKNEVKEEEYEKAVEEVAEKLLSRLPRMPFPPASGSNSYSASSSSTTATDEAFSFEATLNRISNLQATLSMHQTSSHLLRNQIKREQQALKHDKAQLTQLEDAWKSSQALRRKQERGLHPLARAMDYDNNDRGNRDVGAKTLRMQREALEKTNAVAGIRTTATDRQAPSLSTPTDLTPDEPDGMEPLLKQLRNHLHSMQNNTESMHPVLAAMSEAQSALDLFTTTRLGGQARQMLGVLAT